MADEDNGQQVTVAELLKRMGAEQASGGQSAPAGRRHRRAAGDGSISVSELTGEIPRITDDTKIEGRAARRRARDADADSVPAEARTRGGAPSGGTVEPAADEDTTTSAAPAQPAPMPSAQRANPRSAAQPSPSGAVQRPTPHRPAGNWPSAAGVQAPPPAQSKGSAPDSPLSKPGGVSPSHDAGRAGERALATDAGAQPPRQDPAESGRKKGLRGLFGRRSKEPGVGSGAQQSPGGAGSGASPAATATAAAVAPSVAGTPPFMSGGQQPAPPQSAEPAQAQRSQPQSQPQYAAPAASAAPASADSGLLGAPSGAGSSAARPASESSAQLPPGAAAGAGVSAATAVVPAADTPAGNSADTASDGPADVPSEGALDQPRERSSAAQWALLVAQILASAVAGAALFIGFQLLWRDLPWVAMALAVVVIVGLVAMVRVLRRSNDWVSIVLAIVVGLGVTCGPLLLRLLT